MNIVKIAEEGRKGQNQGLTIGLSKLNESMCGLNKYSYIAVGGANKSAKTTAVNIQFIISVFLNNPNKNIKWVYFSYEMNRVQMAFRFSSYFLYKEYGEKLSTNYLMGRAKDSIGKPILISDKHLQQLKYVNDTYIIPLFGEYDDLGKLTKEGKILFFDKKDEPDNIKKFLEQLCLQHGNHNYENYVELINGIKTNKKKLASYTPNKDSPHIIVILDHLRKLKRPQGFDEKATTDLMSGYFAELAAFYGLTCIGIIHSNREANDLDLIKFLKDGIYVNETQLKGTGNVGEDCTELITIFDGKDPKFKLKTHFGLSLDFEEDYRCFSLVLSRYSECPIHVQTYYDGVTGNFTQIER